MDCNANMKTLCGHIPLRIVQLHLARYSSVQFEIILFISQNLPQSEKFFSSIYYIKKLYIHIYIYTLLFCH